MVACFFYQPTTAQQSTFEVELELQLCNLLRHTPLYNIYQLEIKSNCLSQVRAFDELLCLRNKDNQVNISLVTHCANFKVLLLRKKLGFKVFTFLHYL